MAQQNINVGTNPNDGTGDSLRNGFIKTNDNFTELYSDKENTANKSATTTLGTSNVLFPTQNAVKTYVDNGLSTKQNTLISGTNIKTINSTSLLGSGNISVQETLVSGTNIKTINGNSILGSGDLTITGGISGSGTDNYIPRFNGTTALENSIIFDNGTNVGIGTSSPVTKLDLGSSTGQKLSIYSSGNDRAGFGIETSTLRYYTPTNTIHSFGHLSTSDGLTFSERMRIDSNGKVGIGTSSPSETLQVVGTFKAGDFSNPSLDVGATEISANVDSNKIILRSSGAQFGNYGSGVELGVNTLSGARVYFENSIGNKFGLQESDNLLVTDNGLIQDTVVPSDATTPVKWIRINDIASGDQFLIPVYA